MFCIRQPYQKRMTSLLYRNFGAGHHHYERASVYKKSENTTYKVPVEEGDLDQEYGKSRGLMLHNRLTMKFLSVFKSHRVDQMDNMRVEKNSAYYWFPRIPLLRNGLFLKIMTKMFDSHRSHMSSVYDDPVQIHENSIFLYKTMSTPEWIGARAYDYVALSFLIYGTCISTYPLLWLPAIPYLFEFPKFYTM